MAFNGTSCSRKSSFYSLTLVTCTHYLLPVTSDAVLKIRGMCMAVNLHEPNHLHRRLCPGYIARLTTTTSDTAILTS